MPAAKNKTQTSKLKVKTAKPKITLYTATKVSMYHPYQGVRFEVGVPTACNLDSWLDSQIKANLISEVSEAK